MILPGFRISRYLIEKRSEDVLKDFTATVREMLAYSVYRV